jgi:hypothetical protein
MFCARIVTPAETNGMRILSGLLMVSASGASFQV